MSGRNCLPTRTSLGYLSFDETGQFLASLDGARLCRWSEEGSNANGGLIVCFHLRFDRADDDIASYHAAVIAQCEWLVLPAIRLTGAACPGEQDGTKPDTSA